MKTAFSSTTTPLWSLTALSAVLFGGCLSGCGGGSTGGVVVGELTTAQKCDALKGKAVGNDATIVSAAIQPAVGANGPNTQSMSEYCNVTVKANDSALQVQIYMPTTAWNTKMLQRGGGGFKGSFAIGVPSPSTNFGLTSPSIVAENYAVVGSNGGHDAAENTNAAFALDTVKLNEYTHLAEHRAANFGKAVIQQYYGSAPSKSYFEGCSTGGHDAMMEAIRYPEDFDGIVARAPAGNFIGLYLRFNRISTALRAPGGTLNANKQTLLANAVLSQCDAMDGAADGVISKPSACNFDPKVLRCAAGDDTGDGCLSDAQINTVNAVTAPFTTADGKWSHPGFNFGGENLAAGWGQYVWPPSSGLSAQQMFSDQWVRSFITKDPAFDPTTFDPNQWLPQLSSLGALWQAFDPNLSRFQARGGKLIMWSGTLDTSVSPRDTARYYDMVVQQMGQSNTDKTLETFFAPGVSHCGVGNPQPGPEMVDLLKPLSIWVEQGTPPSQQNLKLQKFSSTGAVTVTKPLCKYPSYPRYKGSGDLNQASSYTCSTQ